MQKVNFYALFILVPSCLEKNQKNIYNNFTEMTMCFCCCAVVEWNLKWYCCGCGLVSNVVTAFEYNIWKRNVACVCGKL